eukprot:366576-Chlamydomonas_euryale.AAC.10
MPPVACRHPAPRKRAASAQRRSPHTAVAPTPSPCQRPYSNRCSAKDTHRRRRKPGLSPTGCLVRNGPALPLPSHRSVGTTRGPRRRADAAMTAVDATYEYDAPRYVDFDADDDGASHASLWFHAEERFSGGYAVRVS